MNIGVLSGARKNAGDYLITERCEKLLCSVYDDAVFFEYPINEDLSKHVDEINANDLIVVPGGPVSTNEYPNCVPIVQDLTMIKRPMIGIGLGWYGKNDTLKEIYSYKLSDETKRYLTKLSKQGMLSCRDWYTVRAFRNNGILKPIMTGCPAWYDMDYIGKSTVRSNISSLIKRISVSDPARIENRTLVIPIIDYLQKKFPNAKIDYIFHRGIQSDKFTGKLSGASNNKIKEELIRRGVDVHDISYSSDGLMLYDSCDLHVGFRVHAHIYCLSHRGISILIEEDGRGAGVNSALGLERIAAYQFTGFNSLSILRNTWILKSIDDCIEKYFDLGYYPIIKAFEVMNNTYEVMRRYIENINTIL